MKRIGYELIDESSFVAVRSGLTRWGIDFSEGGEPNGDGVEHWLRFTDPGGFEIELYVGMAWRDATPPADDGEVTLEKLVHGGWEVTDWDTNVGFYQEVLGFKASDWIGDAVGFFRAGDRYHHSLVLIRAQRPAFNHFCVQVSSLDDVMRFRNNALTHNVKIKDDLLRHAPSGSVGVYVMDEARGFAVEYCVGHPRVDDEDHVARQLPMSPETIDVWKAALPERSPLPGDLSRYDELRG
jgi:catechol 2,3-dioxygenase-like lactoylglutathione lyase family enzyme